MLIEHSLTTMGIVSIPLFILLILCFFIGKKIHRESVCKKCGSKKWLLEEDIVETDESIVKRLIFKCVSCGHIRSEYKIIETEK